MGKIYKVRTNAYTMFVETDCTNTVMRYMTDCTTGGNTPLMDVDLDEIEDTSSWATDAMYTPLAEFLTGDKFADPIIAQHTDTYDILGVRDDWHTDGCYWYAVQTDGDNDAGTGSYDYGDAVVLLRTAIDLESPDTAIIATFDLGGAEPTCIEERNAVDILALLTDLSAHELAFLIRANDEWDMDDCKALCHLAGIEYEWEEASGEEFEDVVYEAADILGVRIFKGI